MEDLALGIDIGGSGIKAGLVDLTNGELVSERYKIDTPQPSTPEAVAETIRDLVNSLDWSGKKIGVGFPAIIQDGVALSAANIDKGWLGKHVGDLLHAYTGHEYFVINDADAAGLSERLYGKIYGTTGTVIMLTLGTGIGSAIFHDGVLLPNTELGHIEYQGTIAENRVSNRARKERELDYATWATELAKFLEYIILLFSPRQIVLGGGISFRFEEYAHHFSHLRVPVTNAVAYNDAGIIGAALAAYPELLVNSL